jgi:hypothetical protein
MKTWSLAALLATNILFTGISFADEAPPSIAKIPTEEKAFVEAINQHNKASIVAQFGEPAKAEDVKVKGSGKIAASIWQYHNLNTAEDGSFYPTTELDFIDDKVVQVVFLNNDGSEANDGKTYEFPNPNSDTNQAEPIQTDPNM